MTRTRWLAAAGLLGMAISVSAQGAETPTEKFWKACRTGDIATVKQMLDAGQNVNQDFGTGVTPLGAAAARGHAEVVQLLLDRGANPNARDDVFKLTPLTMAFFFGQPKLIPILMPRTTEDLDTVLRFASMMGAVPLVEATLKAKVQPHDLAVAWAVAEAAGKKEVLAVLEKNGVKAPARVEPADYSRYLGTYMDKSKLELTLELREGKLLATGGSGFSEFFEQEAISAGPGLMVLKTNPGIFFQFSGEGEKFPRAALMVGNSVFPLERVSGGGK